MITRCHDISMGIEMLGLDKKYILRKDVCLDVIETILVHLSFVFPSAKDFHCQVWRFPNYRKKKQVMRPRVSTTGPSSKTATVFSSLQGTDQLWLIQWRSTEMFIHSIDCSVAVIVLGRRYVLERNNIACHCEEKTEKYQILNIYRAERK